MDEILNRIKNSDSFKNIIAEYDPEIVYLGGSRGIGYNREDSDYDIVVYTNQTDLHYKNIPLNIEGIHAHCLLYSIEELFKVLLLSPDAVEHVFQLIGLVFGLTSNSILIYKKENGYTEIFDFVKTHLEEISFIFTLQLLTKYKRDLDAMVVSKSTTFNNKIYYYFLIGAQIVFGEDYSNLIKTVVFKQSWTEELTQQMWEVLGRLQKKYSDYNVNDYLSLSAQISYLFSKWKEVVSYGNNN